MALEKEFNSLLNHYQALKEKFVKNVTEENRFERKYKEEKRKTKELSEKLSKAEKRKPAKINSKDVSKKSKPLGSFAANNAFLADDSSTSLEGSLFKRTSIKVFEKENSPKKDSRKKKLAAKNDEKLSVPLTFSGLQPDLKRNHSCKTSTSTRTSSPKIFKQQKLPYSAKPSFEATKSKTVQIVQQTPAKSDDDNEPYCFQVERSKTSNKKFSPKTPSLKRVSTSGGLFNFDPLLVRDRDPKPESAQFTMLSEVKQEKLSDRIEDSSIPHMFRSTDSCNQESSVEFVEPEEQGPVEIEDTVLSAYGSLNLNHHDRNFLDQTESFDNPSLPPRKRKIIYGDCRECKEFYDAYAVKYGATQANCLIRECPNKCKGYNWRKKQAEPPQPEAPSFIQRDTDNQTPTGFWNISITKTQDDDPDKTLDGL